MLQGYVHDESAAFMGGVSGNAGLFSTARDVAKVYQLLIDGANIQLFSISCHIEITKMH